MLPTIEICIDDGVWVHGKCWRTERHAITPRQIHAACRQWKDALLAVDYPVEGVFWRYIGHSAWNLAPV